ncbi:LysR family transcriptional regulator [Effusibacillus pohliae]|uniref:LysR family transcriptional regulator n=1 Tax=Effusibacillus pohliae TaxID=232270 RepID=UPI0003A92E0C|nr:LysR family transcriptional regulator [Effusibacillus pohliae]
MEIRQMQYVIKVAEERSFSRAAEKLHISQPSLSQQILKIEQQLGVKLFDRTANPLELTYAGERFVATAARILDLTEQLRREMEDVADFKKGRLVIGSLPITGAHVLPAALPIFQQRFPGIEVVLVEGTTSELEELTAKGKTDFTLLTLPLQDPALQYEPILTERILLAVPPQHPLARRTRDPQGVGVRLPELRDEPFILLKRGQGFRQIVLELCGKAGFEPRIAFESSNIETVQSLVAAGMGIAFVPEMVARSGWASGKPVYLSPTDPVPTRTLVVAYREGNYLSRAAIAFIGLLKEVFAARQQG